MTEMVERVGEALWAELSDRGMTNDIGDDLHAEIKEALARAAIEAMREPSVELLRSGAEALIYPTVSMGGPSELAMRSAGRIYAAMIDAALAGEAG